MEELLMARLGTAFCLTEEQETTIQYSRVDDYANICTSDSTQKTKFDKLVESNPEHWTLISKDEVFNTYRCTPKSLISARSKVVKRDLTPEQRAAIGERFKNSKDENK